MKTFKGWLIVGTGTLVILLFCGLYGLFWDGYYLPNKPCRPIEYPTAERINPKPGEVYEYLTDNEAEDVIDFFDDELNATVLSEKASLEIRESASWMRKKIDARTYVYQCIASDINGSTAEQSCLYVKEVEQGTLIETVLWRFETTTWACDDSSIIP